MTQVIANRLVSQARVEGVSDARRCAAHGADIMARLKSATASHHSRVDSIVEPCLSSREKYCRLMLGLGDAIRAVQCGMAPWRDELVMHDVDLKARSKTEWLAADEKALGLDPHGFSSDFRLDSAASAVGALYVVEGSTLGGQVIVRLIESRLGITSDTGARYFFGYGSDTGRMWKRTRGSIEKFAAVSNSPDEIIGGAVATFELFGECLEGAIG